MDKDNSNNSTAPKQERTTKQLVRLSVLIPILIVVIAIVIAGFAIVSYYNHNAEILKSIHTENKLKMECALEHVEEYFGGVYSDLLYISQDPSVKAMNDDSREHIQALYDHQYERHCLSEIYVIERDFDGTQQPFMTFEHGSEQNSEEELHSLEREEEEYRVQVEQIRRFIADPTLKAQISKEIRLCLDQPGEAVSRGVVYSLPIISDKELVGIVAAMVPTQRIKTALEIGLCANIAIIVNEQGDLFGCENLLDKTRSWFENKYGPKGVAGFFKDAPETFQVNKWTTFWAPAKIISDQRWWLAFQYDKAVYMKETGFLQRWGLIGGILLVGIFLALFLHIMFKRYEEKEILLRERKRAYKEITTTKNYLDNIIESSLDCIIVSDNTGNITRANKSFLKLIGYKEEVIGMHMTELSPTKVGTHKSTTGELVKIGEEFLNDAKSMIARLFEEGKIESWESYLVREDKKVVPVEENIVILYNTKREVTGSVGIIRDTTERKKAEKEIMESRDKLFQLEKIKSLGELAGGVAHNFNNLLAVILGNAQLLKMVVEPPPGEEERRKSVLELKKGLEIIEDASRDGAELVRKINEFTRVKEDKSYTTVNINEIIDHTLEFTKTRWKDEAESTGVTFDVQRELSSLPPIEGSSSELREVFTNIINNALDAMPQGGEIRIKTFEEDNQIVINIEDTGTGIPKSIRDRIFDPFFTTKGVQSTGLGMSVSYGTIHRHKGTISIESVEGEGTTFTIKLPISGKIVKEKEVKPIQVEQRKAKILVIEDEEQVRNLLSAILKKGGHEVEMVSDGNQGIEVYKEKEFDLVFTDLGMPGMSGWQVAEKIKGINERVPVVLITGWDIRQEESEMKDSYVDLIIHKPFEMDQVLNIVQEGMILRERFKAT